MSGDLLLRTLAKVRKDKFMINSLIFLVGSFLVGLGNYIYQLITARLLSVEVYGELQSLLAILAVISVLTSAFSTVLTKYAADFKAKNQPRRINALLSLFNQESLLAAGILFAIFVVFSGPLAGFLKINSIFPLIILGAAILFSFSSAVNYGIIRGLQKFRDLSVISLIPVLLKILLVIIFIHLGFALNGAVGAVILASLAGYLISFYPLRHFVGEEKEPIETKGIFRYFFPVFFTLLFSALLLNIDIVLVKHFFSAALAGQYAALAMLGHIIFFVVAPIVGVMFPMAADAYGSAGYPAKILKRAIAATMLISTAIMIVYFFSPNLVIKVLIGSKFLPIGKYLGWFGLAMLLYSLVAMFANYFLSVGRAKSVYLVGLGAALQLIFISVFHADIWQIVWIMNGTMAVTLALLVFYFLKIYYLCPQK